MLQTHSRFDLKTTTMGREEINHIVWDQQEMIDTEFVCDLLFITGKGCMVESVLEFWKTDRDNFYSSRLDPRQYISNCLKDTLQDNCNLLSTPPPVC